MQNTLEYRPRRSCLYMPGANERALEKAKSLPADMLILDLEDAVAPDVKKQARLTVANAVMERAYGDREVLIRSNAIDTEWGRADLEMAVGAAPHGVLVPKVTSASDVIKLDALLSELGASAHFALWVMIEMPLAILNIQEIAAASQSTRLHGFVMGTNDLAKELSAVATTDRSAFQYSLSVTLLAARAYGVAVIDGVYNDFKNELGFTKECEAGRVMGFDGKSLIHPAQIDEANRVFSPDQKSVAHAQDIIEAFSLPENKDKGVIKVNGAMVELLHLEQARHTIAIQAAIDKRR